MKVQSKVYKNQYLMCYYKLVYKFTNEIAVEGQILWPEGWWLECKLPRLVVFTSPPLATSSCPSVLKPNLGIDQVRQYHKKLTIKSHTKTWYQYSVTFSEIHCCMHINIMYTNHSIYRIVPGKHKCALRVQAPKLRVGSSTLEVLEWFNYPHASTYPG